MNADSTHRCPSPMTPGSSLIGNRAARGLRTTLVAATCAALLAGGALGAPAHAQAGPPVAASAATSSTAAVSTYVTAVYRDLFARTVDPAGLSTWTQALLSGTPRIAVANAITYSREYRSRLITDSYRTYLDRSPDSAGLRHWLDQMHDGLPIQQMEGGFLASPEYYRKAGSTPRGWVVKLYSHVLGRTPSESEIAHWTTQLSRGASRTSVAMGFLLSSEHLADVVDAQYRHLLGRSIDSTGRTSWVRAIQTGTRLEAVIGGIVASDEYAKRNGAGDLIVAAPPPPPAPAPAGSVGVPSGKQLRVHDGNLTITTAGTVVDGLDIRGFVRVKAPNVVIRNSVIRGPGEALTYPMSLVQSTAGPAGNLLIEDTTIAASHPSRFVDGVVGQGFTLRRVDIHTVIDQVKITGDNVTVDSSRLHKNLFYPAADGHIESHDDNVQVQVGSNIRIVNNTMSGTTNAAVMITQDRGLVRNFTFSGNRADNGACTVNVFQNVYGPPQGLSITDNVFGTNQRNPRCAIIMSDTTKAVTTVARNTFTDGTAVTVSRGR